MHYWGDDWPHWNELYRIERLLGERLYKKTGCILCSKEKYGTLRYEHVVPPQGSPYVEKFAVRTPWKKKTPYGSYRPLLWSWTTSWIYLRWQAWGWKVLTKLVLEAAIKYPHLRRELLEDLAIHEKLVGKEIHNEFWTSTKTKE